MTPPTLDAEVIAARLRLLADTLADLSALRDVDAERLRAEPLTRAAAERLLQVAVDLAVDVNAHISVARLGRAPATGRESFVAAAEAGALEGPLAERLAPAAGLRNVLVHRYTDIRVDLVAGAVAELLELLPTYIEQVASFLRDATTT